MTALALFALYMPLRQTFGLGTIGHTQIYGFYADVFAWILIIVCASDIFMSTPSAVPLAIRVTGYAFLAIFLIALLEHPSAEGAVRFVRMLEVAAVAASLARLERIEALVVGSCLGISLVFETVLAIAELIKGDTVGWSYFGEQPSSVFLPSRPFPQATFLHPYYLAGFALLSGTVTACLSNRFWDQERAFRFLGYVGCSAGAIVAITYSRMALLGFLGVVVAFLVLRPRRALFSALLLVAFLVPAIATANTWVDKGKRSIEAGDNNSRTRFAKESLSVIAKEPLIGVGPSRYSDFRTEHGMAIRDNYPVHNVPLLIASETGILGGLLAGTLIVLLGWSAFRAQPPVAIPVFVCFIPFLLLDCFPYCDPQSTLFTGLWIGSILMLSRAPVADDV